ncbi:MAG: hypothetical protein WD425_14660 [Nitrospirales bacterium]
MTEIMESITINNVLTGMFMTGSLWGTLLLSRMVLPLPQGLTRHSRNTILMKSFRNNSFHECDRKRNDIPLEK